ncbi:MAG: hypothetical protein AAB454_02055 [Patescibacteria group bacterium]
MKSKKFIITFLSLISGGLVIYFIASNGWYPIAIVNGKFITEQNVRKEYSAAARYYVEAFNVKQGAGLFRKEIRRAVLDKLIENVLIYDGLKERLGGDVTNAVSEKLQNLNMNEAQVGEATAVLYGLTFQEFKDIILIPQATKEILEVYLSEEKKDIGGWLKEARAGASVTLLIKEFSWKDSQLMIGR